MQDCCEMDTKIEVKEEPLFTNAISYSEKECISKYSAFGLSSNVSAGIAEMDVKEEPSASGFCSQNERELLTEIKGETVVAGNYCERNVKTEIKEETVISNYLIQNEMECFLPHHQMEIIKCNRHHETDIKVEPEEEKWWQEGTVTETRYLYDPVKNKSDKNFTSAESTKLYAEGLSGSKATLCSDEYTVKDINVNVRSCSSENELSSKCNNQESDIIQISSAETVVHSYQLDSVKKESMTLKQDDMTQFKATEGPNICNKTCAYQAPGIRNYFDHTTDKQYKCNYCNKSFSYLSYLKRHISAHNGEKPYKCDICEKNFTQSSTLNTHKLLHEGIKPYKCHICKKAFTQAGNWRIHKLIHEEKRPYKCNVCEKSFAQWVCLKKHNLIHEGIKPLKCDICKQWFTVSTGLQKDTFLHEGEKPYRCHICTKSFAGWIIGVNANS